MTRRLCTAARGLAVVGLSTAALTAVVSSAGSAAPSCTATWQPVSAGAGAGDGQYVLPPSVTAAGATFVLSTSVPGGYGEPVEQDVAGRLRMLPALPSTPLTAKAGWPGPASFDSPADGWVGQDFPFAALRGNYVFDRWNSGRWTETPTALPPNPARETLEVRGLESVASDDAWAAGYLSLAGRGVQEGAVPLGAAIEHWDGVQWTLVPNPLQDTEAVLSALTAISATSVYAAGVQVVDGALAPLLEHWDGTAWSVVPVPTTASGAKFLAISANGPSDIWATGVQAKPANGAAEPFAERYDGSRWSIVPRPSYAGLYELNSVYVAGPDDVWAQGSYVYGAVSGLLHWNGTAWTKVGFPKQENGATITYGPGGVGGSSPTDVWSTAAVEHLQGATKLQILHLGCRVS